MLRAMRVRVPSMVLLLALGSASGAIAEEKDAEPPQQDSEAPAEGEAEAKPEEKPKKERSRLVKPDGSREDNEQLGGEPSLTEVKDPPPGEPAAQVEETEGCDLDCIEAELDKQDEKEQRKKGTLTVARESGSVSEVDPADSGDSLAAEPSTTTIPEAAVDPSEDRKLPTRLGPVRIRVGKSDDWVGIGLATQMEFQSENQFESAGFPSESEATLEFRRIRATLSSSFIEGRIRSRFQINLTPSAFELIDLWFSFTRFKFATFRVGQFKIPYDRYRAQSFAALSMVDWAPTTRMFGSERQIGAEMLASGGIFNLEYSIGIFSGVNARAAHGVGIAEVYGEEPTNASDLGFGDVVSAFHPEIAARVAKNFGEINTNTNTDTLGTKVLRHSIGTGIAWDARPDPAEDLALRLSVEWLGKIRHVHMNVVSYLAWFKPWEDGRIRFGPYGFMGEVGYRFTEMWELALRYSVTALTDRLRQDARTYGEFQILNAADPAEAMLQYGRNGEQKTNEELALAGTSHIIGNSLKVVAEVSWQTQLWITGRRHGFRSNLQLQLLF